MPRTRSSKVSSRDVAEAAGVSRTTVSFVLNEHPNAAAIPMETRRRVLAIAESLGYAPSPEARALRAGRSDVVLCLMPHWPITGPFGEFLQELSSEFYQVGLTMLIHQRSPGEDLGQVFGSLTPTAVVAIGEMTEADVELAARRGISVTPFMGQVPDREDVSGLKQSNIATLQTQFLLDHGHKSLAYVLPANEGLDWFSQPRLQAAVRTAERGGASLTQVRLDPVSDLSAATQLLGLVNAGVTGVCAYNDEVALALLLAAAEVGVAVPTQLSVIGVDDLPLCVLVKPHLTTIAFDFSTEAKRLARILLGQEAETSPPPASTILTVRERDSVGRVQQLT